MLLRLRLLLYCCLCCCSHCARIALVTASSTAIHPIHAVSSVANVLLSHALSLSLSVLHSSSLPTVPATSSSTALSLPLLILRSLLIRVISASAIPLRVIPARRVTKIAISPAIAPKAASTSIPPASIVKVIGRQRTFALGWRLLIRLATIALQSEQQILRVPVAVIKPLRHPIINGQSAPRAQPALTRMVRFARLLLLMLLLMLSVLSVLIMLRVKGRSLLRCALLILTLILRLLRRHTLRIAFDRLARRAILRALALRL